MATYRATLRGDRLEWNDAPPPELGAPVSVEVIIHTEAPPTLAALRSRRMAAALERLAARGGLKELSDPLAWERAARTDRALPERE